MFPGWEVNFKAALWPADSVAERTDPRRRPEAEDSTPDDLIVGQERPPGPTTCILAVATVVTQNDNVAFGHDGIQTFAADHSIPIRTEVGDVRLFEGCAVDAHSAPTVDLNNIARHTDHPFNPGLTFG